MAPSKQVMAKVKPLAELPPEFLCCERMRQRVVDTSGEVLIALPNSMFVAEIECLFCHRVLEDVKYVRILRNPRGKGTCIPVACYDFDEGATSDEELF